MKNKKIPYIGKDHNNIKTLFVDNEAFMVLGGEIHNSSASGNSYMNSMVWPYLKGLNLNTVIVPVYWEAVEKIKGQYDFTIPKKTVERARIEDLKIVFLWFGLWKNGESTYIPGWMKRDNETYFSCCYQSGKSSQTISPLCSAAVSEDKKAFVKFMEFIKEIDSGTHTVIMVQLENEIGFLGSDNDYSEAALAARKERIPKMLEELYSTNGSWQEAFGSNSGDYFMTWHFASAIEEIAAAGKKIYPIPVYINAWLDLFPFRPGTYPTGGPVAKMLPLWSEIAKSLDFFAPDIYDSDFDGICEAYSRGGNPLFIPEARRDKVTASNVFQAFAKYHAIGFSPFGIEDFLNQEAIEPMEEEQLKALNIDTLAFYPEGTGHCLSEAYSILKNIKKLYFEKRECISGFRKANEHQKGCIVPFPEFDVILTYLSSGSRDTGSAGMIIRLSSLEFYIIGCNTAISLLSKPGSNKYVVIESMEEGCFKDSAFIVNRVLNGDELRLNRLGDIPSVLKLKAVVYSYKGQEVNI